jgi:hypothetical protein
MSDRLGISNNLLQGIPESLRVELIDAFRAIVTNYQERRWEPAELNGGKFSEVVYSVLLGYIEGQFPSKPSKPRNFLDACKKLELSASPTSRSVRIQIPRILLGLYEIRNNRNVGHVGGDVDPNEMDATFVLYAAKWVMAELIRIFHSVSSQEALHAIESLMEKDAPLVWVSGETKRVLDTKMSYSDQVLVLLYNENGPAKVVNLLNWTEYGNISRFKNELLKNLHRRRLIEYDKNLGSVLITPLGSRDVEQRILQRTPI